MAIVYSVYGEVHKYRIQNDELRSWRVGYAEM